MRLLAVCVAALICSGCAAQIVPPTNVIQPVQIYVIDYGRHASLLLPGPDHFMVEYAIGDWDYLARNHKDLYHATQALFWSPQAALSRHYVSDDQTLGRRQLSVIVESARAAALRHELDTRFEHDADVALIYNERDHLWCAADPELYWLGHNCNHVTAAWLQQLGCSIQGTPLTSKFTVRR